MMSFSSVAAFCLASVLVFSFPVSSASAARLLSIDEARSLALRHNKDLLIAASSAEASLGRLKAEKGGFDPVFDVRASYDKTSEPSESALVSDGIETRRSAVSAGIAGDLPTGAYYDLFRLSVSKDKSDSPLRSLSPSYSSSVDFRVGQNLLRGFGGGAAKTAVASAALRSDISNLSLRARAADTLFEVERAYWNLVAARLNAELTKQYLELGSDLLERNRVKVREGVLPRLEEMKAESAVAARRVELIEAENFVKRAEDHLKNLIGLPLDTAVLPADLPFDEDFDLQIHSDHTDISALIEAAFENRAELKQAQKQVKIAEREKSFRKNQRLPGLALEGVVSLRGLAGGENPDRLMFGEAGTPGVSDALTGGLSDSLDRVREGDFVSWGASVKMSVPIGNRRASGLYAAASAELDGAVLQYGKVREAVALEVREAADALWSAAKRVEAADTALAVAREVLEAEKEKYAVGLSTTREVLEAQTGLVLARSENVRAAADYKTALAALRRATGTIIEETGVEF